MMRIERITPQEYAGIFPEPAHVFNTVPFSELNRRKCDGVRYLAFVDGERTRFGLIAGERGGELTCPFSAPFGGMEERGAQRVAHYIDAVQALMQYAQTEGCKIRLTLPPAVYGRVCQTYSKQVCALSTCGVKASYIDYNYHYDLNRAENVVEYFNRAARKNYVKACETGWTFSVLTDSEADIERAYEVIRRNRESHGYPLRMTLDDVKDTSKIVKCTFLVLSTGGEDVASVVAYDVAPGIVQIVYWGDVPGYSELRPMNMLAAETFRYFDSRGTRILDIGPSSTGGVPSFGLCDFKESLGCEVTPKMIFEI